MPGGKPSLPARPAMCASSTTAGCAARPMSWPRPWPAPLPCRRPSTRCWPSKEPRATRSCTRAARGWWRRSRRAAWPWASARPCVPASSARTRWPRPWPAPAPPCPPNRSGRPLHRHRL